MKTILCFVLCGLISQPYPVTFTLLGPNGHCLSCASSTIGMIGAEPLSTPHKSMAVTRYQRQEQTCL
jgi:hypothetical protein